MELNGKLLDEVIDIFRKVEYGNITFTLSPENKYLQYEVKETKRIQLEEITEKTA